MIQVRIKRKNRMISIEYSIFKFTLPRYSGIYVSLQAALKDQVSAAFTNPSIVKVVKISTELPAALGPL